MLERLIDQDLGRPCHATTCPASTKLSHDQITTLGLRDDFDPWSSGMQDASVLPAVVEARATTHTRGDLAAKTEPHSG